MLRRGIITWHLNVFTLFFQKSLESILLDFDECEESPCGNNATCNNTEGSYTCLCNNGYVGNGLQCSGERKGFL